MDSEEMQIGNGERERERTEGCVRCATKVVHWNQTGNIAYCRYMTKTTKTDPWNHKGHPRQRDRHISSIFYMK